MLFEDHRRMVVEGLLKNTIRIGLIVKALIAYRDTLTQDYDIEILDYEISKYQRYERSVDRMADKMIGNEVVAKIVDEAVEDDKQVIRNKLIKLNDDKLHAEMVMKMLNMFRQKSHLNTKESVWVSEYMNTTHKKLKSIDEEIRKFKA